MNSNSTNYLANHCQAWKHYSTLTVLPHRTFLHIALTFSGENSTKKNFSGHFPGFSLGNNSNRASVHICTGRKNKGKYELTYECRYKARRPSVLVLASTYCFLHEFGSPRSRIPIPQTCRPTKQTLLLKNSNKGWRDTSPLYFIKGILCQGKTPQKGCGKKFQCPS